LKFAVPNLKQRHFKGTVPSIVLKSGQVGRPRTRPTWGKNRERKNPMWPGWPGQKPGCSQLTFVFFLLKQRCFDLKKNWPGRPGDPVKTWWPGQNPEPGSWTWAGLKTMVTSSSSSGSWGRHLQKGNSATQPQQGNDMKTKGRTPFQPTSLPSH